jgi:hypothetical protein
VHLTRCRQHPERIKEKNNDLHALMVGDEEIIVITDKEIQEARLIGC